MTRFRKFVVGCMIALSLGTTVNVSTASAALSARDIANITRAGIQGAQFAAKVIKFRRARR